ncbi:MAG: LysE family translocator, partial [Anaerolineae bacterium]
MIDPAKLPLFFVASVTIMLIPGPAVLYIITRSVDQGRTAGFISILGLHTGTLVHIVAAALGLSAILLSSALAFSVVKYLGAIYLVYLGIQKLRSHEGIELTESS